MAGSLRRQRALRVAAYLLIVAVTAFGFFRLDRMQHDQCEAFDQFATSLGHELGADDARIDRFIDQFHRDLESC